MAKQEAFEVLSHQSWSLLGFAIVVGVASAATVQILKQFLPVRGVLQRRWVMDWIGNRCAVKALWSDWLKRRKFKESADAQNVSDAQRTAAAEELEATLLGGFAKWGLRQVFNLPVEQLCAQISSAADFALSQPDQYAELLLALAGPAKLESIDRLAPPYEIIDGRILRKRIQSESDQPFAVLAEETRAGPILIANICWTAMAAYRSRRGRAAQWLVRCIWGPAGKPFSK